MERNTKKLNIRIITAEPFPIGMANTNRILTYGKGLTDNDCEVSVHCLKPTEIQGEVRNKLNSGIVNGIYFKYPGGKTIISSDYIGRQVDNMYGVFNTCLDLMTEKKQNKPDAIIFYTGSTFVAFFFFIITRIKKIILLKEESEFPVVYIEKMSSVNKLLFTRLHYKLFDGLLLMTNRLIKYFKEERGLKIPILHVPMTVDFERFNKIKINDVQAEKYIAYCGMLNNKKDGVDLLIDAFIQISQEFPDLKLYLIGNSASEEEFLLYQRKAEQSQLSHRIIFKGYVSKDEIPQLLTSAYLLILPRPHSYQAEGGFPTKLGEYLSTGKPVIATRVGEIPDYLTDGLNAFIAEPGSIKSIVAKIKEIALDYDSALQIGENGKGIVLQHFNYKIQTKKIKEFIESF